jgi:hypothetical protein
VVNVVAAGGIPAAILAHQGGWDEMLLVLGPILLVAGLLWLARRRVTRSAADAGADPGVDTGTGAAGDETHPSV